MFGSYWYIEGADGRHYCFAKEPSFTCPVASAESIGGAEEFAAAIGVDVDWLLRKLRSHSAHRRRVDGKPTDVCEACGHKLTRLGFRYWIESDKPQEGVSETTRRLNRAMGGTGFTMVEGPWYARTKKDAQAWARMRVKQTKEAA